MLIDFLNQIDTQLFLFLNGLHHRALDPAMVIISAKMTWIPLYVLVLGMLIYHFKQRAWLFVLGAIVLLALTDLGSVHLFKNVFLRLRPCHEPALEGLVYTVNNKCGGSYGFVSSHAANTFGFATLLAATFRNRLPWFAWIIVIWAAIVSYSRIYLGVHYPGDILGGAALGTILGWLVWKGISATLKTRLLAGKR
jgi:undecaprenyl-diphosphatase